MKLHKAATYFDRDPVLDGYTGDVLFKGQFASYEGSQADGTVQRRRTLSVGPGVVLPERRVLSIYGELWVVGSPLTDGWEGSPIRRTMICKLATDKVTVATPGDILAGIALPEQTMHLNAEYLKNTVNTVSDSAYDPQFRIWAGINQQVKAGWIIKGLQGDERSFVVRDSLRDPTGFIQGFADELSVSYGFPSMSIAQVEGKLNPVTEVRGPSKAVPMIFMDMYKLYFYRTLADEKMGPGDIAAYVGEGQVKAGETLEVAQYKFQILRAVPMYALGADVLHLRKL